MKTPEEIKEMFPIGSTVRLKGYITRTYAAPVGSLAVVTGHIKSPYTMEELDLLVEWTDGEHTQRHGDYDYRDFEPHLVNENIEVETKPSVKLCPRCNNETIKIKTQGLLVSMTEEETDKCPKCGWC